MLSLRDKLHAKMVRRQMLEASRVYARRVLQDLPEEAGSEVYREVAAAYAAVAAEHNRS